MVELGREIARLRKAQKLTQPDLAIAIGVSNNYVGMVERGERAANLLVLFKIADKLDVQPAALFRTIALPLHGHEPDSP